MTPYFVVGAPSVARRYLSGRGILMSYALTLGAKPWISAANVRELSAFAGSFVLDSGAFSAWRSGTPVVGSEYVAWVREHGKGAAFAICLDVIGDAVASLESWRCMRAVPEDHLHEYIATAPVVSLGRIEGRKSREKTLQFYDEAFNVAPDAKFHALGIASTDVLERYPFASFDACSWERNAAYSNALPWPYSRCQKATRVQAHIEAYEAVEYRPPKQLALRLVREARPA